MSDERRSAADTANAGAILERKQQRFTKLANVLVDDPKIGRLGLLVYLALCRFAGYESRSAFPSIRRLAAVARLSPRSVNAGLWELQERGWLEVEPKFGRQGRVSNLYRLKDKSMRLTQPLRDPPARVARTPLQGLQGNEIHLNETASTRGLNNNAERAPSARVGPTHRFCEDGAEKEAKSRRLEARREVLRRQAELLTTAETPAGEVQT